MSDGARLSRWNRSLAAPSVHPTTLLFTGLLAALVGCLLRDLLLRGRVFFHRDVQLMWYTQVETFVHAVTAREWPVWNPYIGFGQPLWADANTQILYPPTWLNLLMRPWTYYTAYAVAHLLFAGMGLFALARRLGMGRGAAATAGLAWIASGPLLSAVEMWNQLAGAAWMPWAGLAAISTLHTGRRRWAVAWGACQAAQVVSGSLEPALMTAAGIVAYGATMRPWREGVPIRRLFGLAALALAVAVGLSAGQWLPSLAVAARSARANLPAEARTFWSVHPAALLQMLFPVSLAELHLRPEVRRALFEGREPLFTSLYLGLPSLALVGAALAARRRTSALLAGLFVLAVIVALGRHTPVYGLLTAVPPMRSVRYPVKAMLGASLCWALLAGAGFEAWVNADAIARRRWVGFVMVPTFLATAGSGALAALLAIWPERFGPWLLAPPRAGIPVRELLLGTVPSLTLTAAAGLIAVLAAARRLQSSRSAPTLASVVAVVAVVATAAWHDGIFPTAPRDLYTVRPPVVAALQRPDHGRAYVYDYNVVGKSRQYLGRELPFDVTHAPAGWPYPATVALAERLAVFPPTAGAWGIPGSFDRDTPGLAPRALSDLCDLLILVERTPAHLRLLQVGAVADVVALHTDGLQALIPAATADALMDEPVRVFAVPGTRPRAYAVSGARVADDGDALRLLLDAGFDPAGEIVLPSGRAAAVDPTFSGQVVITRLGTDRVTLDATLSAPGYVVLVDAYDPGWRAWIDGRETPVLRANVGFRAVAVGAGRHVVEMRYRPRALLVGLALTSLSVLALAGAGTVAGRRPAAAP